MGNKLPHSSIDFKINEVKTLQSITTRGFFDNDFGELANAISIAYSRYHGQLRNRSFDFDFATDFEMDIEEHTHRVVLHAQALGNYELTTYSIGICAKNGSPELIRRFHFDYVHANAGVKQKVPVSHLQYGGKTGNGSSGMQFNTNLIEHWLSEPRLYFPPINIALLLDIVFCEFRSEKTIKITDDENWRSLVRKNEVFVFKDYFKSISDHIDSVRHTKDCLVRDICYI